MAIDKLHIAVEGILAAVEECLVEEITTGGRLEGIVAYGRMSSDMPEPPYPGIWWYSGAMQAPSDITSQREIWVLPLVLASLTFNDDARIGSMDATRYASEARATILDSMNLGLDYVSGVASDRFDPAAPIHKRKTNFTAMALVNVVFVALR